MNILMIKIIMEIEDYHYFKMKIINIYFQHILFKNKMLLNKKKKQQKYQKYLNNYGLLLILVIKMMILNILSNIQIVLVKVPLKDIIIQLNIGHYFQEEENSIISMEKLHILQLDLVKDLMVHINNLVIIKLDFQYSGLLLKKKYMMLN